MNWRILAVKKINSKQKGKRIELDFVHFLGKNGIYSFRSKQYCGSNGDADVVSPDLENFHFEVKGGGQVPKKIHEFMDQASEDCKKSRKIPVVAMRRDHKEFLMVIRAEDWLKMIDEKYGNIKKLDSSQITKSCEKSKTLMEEPLLFNSIEF